MNNDIKNLDLKPLCKAIAALGLDKNYALPREYDLTAFHEAAATALRRLGYKVQKPWTPERLAKARANAARNFGN